MLETPIYNSFTVRVYYGGGFEYTPEMRYVGGETTSLKNCHYDEMSLMCFKELAKKVGYDNYAIFFYRKFETQLETGLEPLNNDADVLEMSKIELENILVQVYFVGEIVGPNCLKTNHNVGEIDSLIQRGNNVDHENGDENGHESDDSVDSFVDSVYNFSEDEEEKNATKGVQQGDRDGINRGESNTRVNSETLVSIGLNSMTELAVSDDDEGENSEFEEEELNSIDGSESENNGEMLKSVKYKVFVPSVDMNNPIFVPGVLFASAKDLKAAIRSHAIKNIKSIKFPKNEPSRIRAICKCKTCKWFIYAIYIKENSCYQIRTMHENHSCGNDLNHKHLNSTILASRYLDLIRMNTTWKVVDFQATVRKDLKVNITRKQIYRTFAKASELIEGQYKDQYKRLYDYCQELRRSNPGSTIALDTEEDEVTGEHRFFRLYVGLEATRKGFKEGCRKVVGLDGCHLKGPHPGIILTAVGIEST